MVFDSGLGGEMVADYLMQEMGVIEIVRVIDWAHSTYQPNEGFNLEKVIECLEFYIGRVDLIVLGGYQVGELIEELQRRFPQQKFVAPSINFERILRVRYYPEQVAVLMHPRMRATELFQRLREKLQFATLILPDCTGWDELIDDNLMTEEIVRTELAWDFEIQDESHTRKKKKAEKSCSSLSMLAEASLEKREIMKAIAKFNNAAQIAMKDETRALVTTKALQAETLRDDDGRSRTVPNVVLLLDTHLWGVKAEIERAFGWKVRVLDFREKLLHDVCAALKLRGVDGNRSK